MPQAPRSDLTSLFALADYRRLWAMGAGTGTGRWLEMLALGIYVFQLTGSPTLVAVVAIVRMLPYALLGFLVGSLADYLDRKRLLAANFALAAASAAAMAVLAALGQASYAVVLVVTVLLGVLWTTDMPVRRRLIADAVGAERMPAALGFDNSTSFATRALGPLIGGVIYQVFGVVGIFALSTLIYLGNLILALRLEVATAPPMLDTPRPSLRALLTLPSELLYSPRFLIVLGVTAVYNLWAWPVMGMVPVIGQKDFDLAPSAVGALAACDGVGGTLGAIMVGLLARQATLFRFYFLGTLAILVLLLALSLWLTIGSAVAALLLIGIGAAGFSATQYALIYSMTTPETRGRATGFLSIFIGLSTFGHFHTGLMFDRLATPQALRVIALEGLAAMLLLGWLWWRKGGRA